MTPSDAKCLAAIHRLSSGPVAPSYRQIQAECGFGSVSRVYAAVKHLADEGYVRLERTGDRRLLRVIGEPLSPVLLEQMDDLALRSTLAVIAGILAQRMGGGRDSPSPEADREPASWRSADGGLK